VALGSPHPAGPVPLTRATRRLPVRRRLSVLTLSVLSLLLVALPASAADEASPGVIGSFEGLALAAVVGIVVGIIVFAASQGGPADEPDDHHH
jgi:hypothetical protein